MFKPILLESILLIGILVVFFMDLFLPKSKKNYSRDIYAFFVITFNINKRHNGHEGLNVCK